MIMNSVVVILFLVSLSTAFLSNAVDSTTGSHVTNSLKFVAVASRHGNRGTSSDYPGDPYPINNSHFYPYGANALTPHGRVQAFNLGEKLRSLYGGFLPLYFLPKYIYATSDYVERVILTGQCVLAGLFPPAGFQVFNPSINWQPVPLYTNSSDRSEDIEYCPKRIEGMQAPYNEFLRTNAATISMMSEYVYKVTGTNSTVDTLYDLYLKLNSEDSSLFQEFEGYELPAWTRKLYPEPLNTFHNQLFLIKYASTEEVVRLSIGDLLEDIIQAMQSKVSGSRYPDRKMFYNSGHDNTLLCLEIALGLRRSELTLPVEVGSALVVELHQDSPSSKHYVRVLYINSRSKHLEPRSLSLSNCGDPCYFQTLVKNTRQFRTDVNYSQNCPETVFTDI